MRYKRHRHYKRWPAQAVAQLLAPVQQAHGPQALQGEAAPVAKELLAPAAQQGEELEASGLLRVASLAEQALCGCCQPWPMSSGQLQQVVMW